MCSLVGPTNLEGMDWGGQGEGREQAQNTRQTPAEDHRPRGFRYCMGTMDGRAASGRRNTCKAMKGTLVQKWILWEQWEGRGINTDGFPSIQRRNRPAASESAKRACRVRIAGQGVERGCRHSSGSRLTTRRFDGWASENGGQLKGT